MKNLKTLHEKLEEYNRAENEHWMILIDGTRIDFVFIVHSEDINIYPSWWPNADVAETIDSVLELVPKQKIYDVSIYDHESEKWSCGRNNITQEMADRIKEILMEEQ